MDFLDFFWDYDFSLVERREVDKNNSTELFLFLPSLGSVLHSLHHRYLREDGEGGGGKK